MIYTFETRLNLNNNETETLIDISCQYFSKCCRVAWSLKNRMQFTDKQIYKKISEDYSLTSSQINSVINYISTKHSSIKKLKEYEAKQLKSGIEHRLKNLKNKEKSINKLEAKIIQQINNISLNKKHETLNIVNLSKKKLKQYKMWLAIKNKELIKKQSKLNKINFSLEKNKFSLCFGTNKLFHQKPHILNLSTPFKDNESWRYCWNLSRDNFIYSIGKKQPPSCNPEFHYDIKEKKLSIRLNNYLADMRMKTLEKELNLNFIIGNSPKDSKLRMQCKFLTIENVEFKSHNGLANKYLEAILNTEEKSNKTPLTPQLQSDLRAGFF